MSSRYGMPLSYTEPHAIILFMLKGKSSLLLPFLHLMNDGYLAAMPLLLPLLSADISLEMSAVGVLGSLLSLSGVVLALPSGVLSVRFGALRTLSFAVAGYALGFLLLGISSSLPAVTAAFLVAACAFGVFHPIAFTAVARNAEGRLGSRMGTFAATGDIGKIVLSVLVTWLSALISWRSTSLLYAAVAASCFIICLLLTGREEQGKEQRIRRRLDYSSLRSRDFSCAIAASAIDTFASSSLFIFMPFLLVYRGLDGALLGSFTAVFFIGNLLGKVALGNLVDRAGLKHTFIIAELLIALTLLILSVISALSGILVAAFVLGFLTKGTVPITTSMIAASAGENGSIESAYSISSITTSIASTLSPLAFGLIAEYSSVPAIFLCSAFAAVLSIIPAAAIKRSVRL